LALVLRSAIRRRPVGNMHGLLKSMLAGQHKRLNINLIRDIKKAAGVFMTLHGGSGKNTQDLRLVIGAGIMVVHVNTDIRVAWRRGLEEALSRPERDRSLKDSARLRLTPFTRSCPNGWNCSVLSENGSRRPFDPNGDSARSMDSAGVRCVSCQ
jgi:fructose/tagatose bisphosphate aldolase